MSATATAFDRDEVAKRYALRHLKTDPGIRDVYYLPAAPAREIRLVEVNELIATVGPPEPLDFGVGVGGADSHTLYVLDVTPAQWEAVRAGQLALPPGWSLDGAVRYER
jgi:hypothetical protein